LVEWTSQRGFDARWARDLFQPFGNQQTALASGRVSSLSSHVSAQRKLRGSARDGQLNEGINLLPEVGQGRVEWVKAVNGRDQSRVSHARFSAGNENRPRRADLDLFWSAPPELEVDGIDFVLETDHV
jgi:hypothetical protein